MVALEMARDVGLDESNDSWSLQRELVEELARHWDEPDNGLWEIRGPLRRFTHSRVMVWVAFDRAIEAVEKHGLEGPVEEWRALRDKVRAEVLEHGYDAKRNTFTQHYETDEVDASLLVMSDVGFLDGDDPRMLGTIKAVEEDLLRGRVPAALPHRVGGRRPHRRRAPVPGLLVLARGRPTRSPDAWTTRTR